MRQRRIGNETAPKNETAATLGDPYVQQRQMACVKRRLKTSQCHAFALSRAFNVTRLNVTSTNECSQGSTTRGRDDTFHFRKLQLVEGLAAADQFVEDSTALLGPIYAGIIAVQGRSAHQQTQGRMI